MLKVENIQGAYRKDYPIITGVDLSLSQGETLGITGRNGAGKTTLIRAIVNDLPYSSGRVFFDGRQINNSSLRQLKKIGIGVFLQGGQIFPHLTILENLRMALHDLPKNAALRKAAVTGKNLPFFGDSKYNNIRAGNLSGGERNLLALLMVLTSEPRMLILDEPFAGISPSNISLISYFLLDYLRSRHASMILVEQDQEQLKRLCQANQVLIHGRLHPANF